jgi:purine-binding chemotaxis protein CheW
METVEYTDFTVVIILNVQGTVVGAVVDSVAEVLTIAADSIKPAPQFDAMMDARFIVGLVKEGEKTLIVMDVDALMSNAELGIVV